jgi:hypothetical protein
MKRRVVSRAANFDSPAAGARGPGGPHSLRRPAEEQHLTSNIYSGTLEWPSIQG